jgi:hypothetical protein
LQVDVPGLRPRRAKPRRGIGDVQGRLNGGGAFDVDLAGVREAAAPVHRQRVGRRDVPVADRKSVAVGAAVGQRPADRQARAASAANAIAVELQRAAAGDRDVSADRLSYPGVLDCEKPARDGDRRYADCGVAAYELRFPAVDDDCGAGAGVARGGPVAAVVGLPIGVGTIPGARRHDALLRRISIFFRFSRIDLTLPEKQTKSISDK